MGLYSVKRRELGNAFKMTRWSSPLNDRQTHVLLVGDVAVELYSSNSLVHLAIPGVHYEPAQLTQASQLGCCGLLPLAGQRWHVVVWEGQEVQSPQEMGLPASSRTTPQQVFGGQPSPVLQAHAFSFVPLQVMLRILHSLPPVHPPAHWSVHFLCVASYVADVPLQSSARAKGTNATAISSSPRVRTVFIVPSISM